MNSPLFLFLAAKEFFENGSLYAAKHFKHNKGVPVSPFDSTIHSKLCVPATNISFSLELVFKAFLMQAGMRKFGHDLVTLYGLLNIDSKKEIVDHYNSHDTYKNFITIRLINNDGKDHGKTHNFYNLVRNEEEITKMLETHKSAFKNFRYLHEFKDNEEWYFHFREFSNFAFSALSILGQSLNLTVVTTNSNNKNSQK